VRLAQDYRRLFIDGAVIASSSSAAARLRFRWSPTSSPSTRCRDALHHGLHVQRALTLFIGEGLIRRITSLAAAFAGHPLRFAAGACSPITYRVRKIFLSGPARPDPAPPPARMKNARCPRACRWRADPSFSLHRPRRGWPRRQPEPRHHQWL